VTEVATISGQRPAVIGPGRLVLVVGPSGAGKDTLIADDGHIVFPRRIVTREASASEDNEPISPEAFRQACARGDFAVHWEAHGHGYGLPRSIDGDVGAGRTVVVNVSRGAVDAMRRSYADVTVVSITAPPDILAERLATRSRRSDGPLADRLGRVVDSASAKPDMIITNVGDVDDHARALIRVIRGG
jgi:ribose 1,5-bisphosphokinase